MAEHDDHVGILLDKLDELGIADNTIVVYSTDNGAESVSWPDGGITPFHGEKGTTWEGGFRIPQLVRWPGVIKPGTTINDIMSHEDWLPTFLAAAGVPDIVEPLDVSVREGRVEDRGIVNHASPIPPRFVGGVASNMNVVVRIGVHILIGGISTGSAVRIDLPVVI